MNADERIEGLINHFGQTLADLPRHSDKKYVYSSDARQSAKTAAMRFNPQLDANCLPEDYICHLCDVIDRMEVALETALRTDKCPSCGNAFAKTQACSDCFWDRENHYRIRDDYLYDHDELIQEIISTSMSGNQREESRT